MWGTGWRPEQLGVWSTGRRRAHQEPRRAPRHPDAPAPATHPLFPAHWSRSSAPKSWSCTTPNTTPPTLRGWRVSAGFGVVGRGEGAGRCRRGVVGGASAGCGAQGVHALAPLPPSSERGGRKARRGKARGALGARFWDGACASCPPRQPTTPPHPLCFRPKPAATCPPCWPCSPRCASTGVGTSTTPCSGTTWPLKRRGDRVGRGRVCCMLRPPTTPAPPFALNTLPPPPSRPQDCAPPTGPLASAIEASFGSLAALQERMSAAGAGLQGSGWVWLGAKPCGSLAIGTTPNQDPAVTIVSERRRRKRRWWGGRGPGARHLPTRVP